MRMNNLARTMLTVGSALGVRGVLKTVQSMQANDVLGVIGLERRRSVIERAWPALAAAAVGAALGAGAALLVAPSSGTELRHRLSERANDVKERISGKVTEIQGQLKAEAEKTRAA